MTTDGGTAGGPTVRRILLGAQLRRFREAASVSRERAGYTIRASESKISRMELGRVSFKERDVADLLALYGVAEGDERDGLMDMARQANEPGWWHSYGDLMPSWFHAYVGLEEAASRIRTYEVQFVPGLLQTEDYARAVMQVGGESADEVERRVQLRMRRQELLTRKNPPRLWAVVDEAALRRMIGGPRVLRAQLDHLIERTDMPNVTLQVIRLDVGLHAAESGAFTLMRFAEQDLPDVVYVEQLFGALYLDKREDVDEYSRVMDRLAVDGTTPRETVELLRGLRKEL